MFDNTGLLCNFDLISSIRKMFFKNEVQCQAQNQQVEFKPDKEIDDEEIELAEELTEDSLSEYSTSDVDEGNISDLSSNKDINTSFDDAIITANDSEEEEDIKKEETQKIVYKTTIVVGGQDPDFVKLMSLASMAVI